MMTDEERAAHKAMLGEALAPIKEAVRRLAEIAIEAQKDSLRLIECLEQQQARLDTQAHVQEQLLERTKAGICAGTLAESVQGLLAVCDKDIVTADKRYQILKDARVALGTYKSYRP